MEGMLDDRSIRFVATVSLLASIAVSLDANAQTPKEELAAAVDAVVEAAGLRGRSPGLSVVITRGDEVLLAKGYGFAGIGADVPATAGTVFQIGSISKRSKRRSRANCSSYPPHVRVTWLFQKAERMRYVGSYDALVR